MQRGEHDRQDGHGGPRRVGGEDEHGDLPDGDDGADPEQHLPRSSHGDERERGEDDRNEPDADVGEAAVECEKRGRRHCADQPKHADHLRIPCQRYGEAGSGNRRRQHKAHGLRDEVVQRRRGQQRRIAARNPGPDGAERGPQLPIPSADVDARSEHDRRSGGAERDARNRADPAVVHGENEEEHDPEQRHDPAGHGEAAGAEQRRRVDRSQPVGERRAGWRRYVRGTLWLRLDSRLVIRLEPGVRRSRGRRRGQRRRRSDGLSRNGRLGARGRAQLGELGLQGPEPSLERVESHEELLIHLSLRPCDARRPGLGRRNRLPRAPPLKELDQRPQRRDEGHDPPEKRVLPGIRPRGHPHQRDDPERQRAPDPQHREPRAGCERRDGAGQRKPDEKSEDDVDDDRERSAHRACL